MDKRSRGIGEGGGIAREGDVGAWREVVREGYNDSNR